MEILRRKHYSIRTEEAYVGWITRYIYFHNKRHPKNMGVLEIEEFLSHLAVERNVSPSTQNQAFNALLFLYRNVLNISLEGEKIDAVRARKKRNLPVVMTKDEVKKVIMAMSGVNQLMAKLIYGSGKNRFWKLFSQTWRLLLKVTFATLGYNTEVSNGRN